MKPYAINLVPSALQSFSLSALEHMHVANDDMLIRDPMMQLIRKLVNLVRCRGPIGPRQLLTLDSCCLRFSPQVSCPQVGCTRSRQRKTTAYLLLRAKYCRDAAVQSLCEGNVLSARSMSGDNGRHPHICARFRLAPGWLPLPRGGTY